MWKKRSPYYRHPKLLEKPIVVYTASKSGMIAHEDLLRLGVSPACFSDGDPKKHGTIVMGLEVISPQALLERYGKDGAHILIGSPMFYYEIRNQLMNFYGIPDENLWPHKIEIFLASECTLKPMIVTGEQMKALQNTLLEMMGVIHDVCEKHKLKYCMHAGTLLGAARHKGFIPWDDDIDIVMHRNDCKRFIEICKRELPDGYEAFAPREEDSCFFRYGFRKKGTVRRIYSLEDFAPGSNPELDIDIFTYDNVIVPGGKMQRFQDAVNNIIIDAIRLRYGFEDTNARNPFRNISRMLRVLPKRLLCGIQEAVLSVYNKKETEYICLFWHDYQITNHVTFKTSTFSERAKLQFEDREFWAPAEYDSYLRRLFGDYTQPPPEWRRTPHHPVVELAL